MSIEIRLAEEDEIPVVTLKGRLDGYGAQQFDEGLKEIIRDDTRFVVFNLSGVDYLSSAGIRVFVGLKKRLKPRGGTFALVNVGEYPRSVLEMAGFLSVFDIYPTIEKAKAACREKTRDEGLLFGIKYPSYKVGDVTYRVEPGAPGTASLSITGTVDKVIRASITPADVRALGFRDAEYSLGLGALGKSREDAMPLLGEMVTLHGSMVYVPTDGHSTPDFFTPVRDDGEVKIYSGFNVALAGPFHDLVTFEAPGDTGITLGEIYNAIFSLARSHRKDFSGVISLVIWGIIDGLLSSEIRHSPLSGNAPRNHQSIMDPENYTEWMDVNREPRYHGDTLVGFGIGIDLASKLSSFSPDVLSALFYQHPDNLRSGAVYLHTHGVVFRDVPYDPVNELSRQIRAIVRDGEFVDMRHLLDETRLLKAKIGVSYITRIDTRK